MAPSLAPLVTSNSGATPSKRPRRTMPIIPAIPRSLEKRKVKENVRSSQDRGGTGSPVRPISPKQEDESLVETTLPQSQAVPNGALCGSNEQDNVEESGMQEAVVDSGLKKEGGKSTF